MKHALGNNKSPLASRQSPVTSPRLQVAGGSSAIAKSTFFRHCERSPVPSGSGRSEAISKGQWTEHKRQKIEIKNRTVNQGVVVSVNISSDKGTWKENVGWVMLLPNYGLKGDAHAGKWHRQVSLLAQESIDKMRELGLKVGPGDFAENITTSGINLCSLPVGSQLQLGEAKLQVTQIGKVCHDRCAVYYEAGACIMPKEGIFAKVIKGGKVKVGDRIVLVDTRKVAADSAIKSRLF